MPVVGTKANAGAFGLGWSAVLPGEELGGMVLLTPTSIAYTGTSASIGANGSVEFSAVSSLSLNGVFDATYDNYMVAMRHTGSTLAALYTRLRLSGTDALGADYTQQFIQADGTTVSGARNSSETKARFTSFDTSQRYGYTAYIYGPNLAQPTAFRSVTVEGYNNGRILDFVNTHSLSIGYDGLTLIPQTGNITGLVSVYGLVGA